MMNIFDARRMSENIKRIKEQLGSSSQGQEFEQKSHGGMGEVDEAAQDSFEQILVEFGQMKKLNPRAEQVQAHVKKLQDFISETEGMCTNETLFAMGQMYANGNAYTENLNKMGGAGTAEFVFDAIRVYCGK